MGIKIGIVGTGQFSVYFIPLFRAHPLVDEVVLCDLDSEKLQRAAATYAIARTVPSLEALCESDVDAIAIFSQNWLHGPQAVQALCAGKHVYSAVPPGITVGEIETLVRTVEQTGRIYMLGETSYYYPAAIYCRQRFAAGDFGHVVYTQAEYYHDWDEGLYDVMKQRGGSRWLEFAGLPPMYYPTHSISFVVSVTGAYVTHVSCHGFVDQAGDGIYRADVNRWGNTFSNETALCRMSDGSCSIVNEFRRVGYPSAERLNLLVGTQASFHSSASGDAWVTKDRAQQMELDNILATGDRSTEHGTYLGLAAVHPVERLPREFAGLPNEHRGSHQFLVDDFVRACADGHQPPNNVWMAARYVLPGIVAHESARHGGELLAVPDFGRPPVAK